MKTACFPQTCSTAFRTKKKNSFWCRSMNCCMRSTKNIFLTAEIRTCDVETMVQIEFQNVSYSQEEKAILKNISVQFSSGEYITIVGASGGGKSTFLRLCCHLVSPTEGKILINGADIMQADPVELRKKSVIASRHPLFSATPFATTSLSRTGYGIRRPPRKEFIGCFHPSTRTTAACHRIFRIFPVAKNNGSPLSGLCSSSPRSFCWMK